MAANKKIFGKPLSLIFKKKATNSDSKIILQENDNIVSKNEDVAEVFNQFFVNVAKDIGKDYIFNKNNHPTSLAYKK